MLAAKGETLTMEVETKRAVKKIYNDAYSLSRIEFERQDRLDDAVNYKNNVEVNLALNIIDRFSAHNDLILDAGCGTGRISIPCAETGAKVIGIDISVEGIRLAHSVKNRENCDLLLADIEHLPFKDSLFKFVFFFGTLEYIDKPERVLKEAFRVIKSGGRLLLEVRNKHGRKFRSLTIGLLRFLEKLRDARKTPNTAQYYYDQCYDYSLPEINEKLAGSSFKIERYSGHFFILPSDLILFEKIHSEESSFPQNAPSIR